ncbi:MAG: EamA family transporter, partial [Phycicoccus sp.]
MEDNRSGATLATVLLTAVPPAVWGSTYAVTQLWLPPDRPMFGAALRVLPAGLLLLLWARRLPSGAWWWRSVVLGVLNHGAFFALLYIAAYRLPSGLASTLTALSPLVVMATAFVLLGE